MNCTMIIVQLQINQKLKEKYCLITKLCNTENINSDLVAIPKIKTNLTLEKPAYLGMCMLELSKGPMYEIHFEWVNILTANRDYQSNICLVNV